MEVRNETIPPCLSGIGYIVNAHNRPDESSPSSKAPKYEDRLRDIQTTELNKLQSSTIRCPVR